MGCFPIYTIEKMALVLEHLHGRLYQNPSKKLPLFLVHDKACFVLFPHHKLDHNDGVLQPSILPTRGHNDGESFPFLWLQSQ